MSGKLMEMGICEVNSVIYLCIAVKLMVQSVISIFALSHSSTFISGHLIAILNM
jgi:hypothetical protein